MYTVFTAYVHDLPQADSEQKAELKSRHIVDLEELCLISEVRINGTSHISEISFDGGLHVLTTGTNEPLRPFKERQKTTLSSAYFNNNVDSTDNRYAVKIHHEDDEFSILWQPKNTLGTQTLAVGGVGRYITIRFDNSNNTSGRTRPTRIYVEGFSLERIPPSATAVHFLNFGAKLPSTNNRASIEADIMAGIALLEGSKYNQARELVHRAQKKVLQSCVDTRHGDIQNQKKILCKEAAELQTLSLETQRRQGTVKSSHCEGFIDLLRYSYAANTGSSAVQLFGKRIPEIARKTPFLDGDSLLLQLHSHLVAAWTQQLSCASRPAVRIAAANLLDHMVRTLDVQIGTSLCQILESGLDGVSQSSLANHSAYHEPVVRLLDTCAIVIPNFSTSLHVRLQRVISSVFQQTRNTASIEGKLQLMRFLWICLEKGQYPIEDTEVIHELLVLLKHKVDTVRAAARKCWAAMRQLAPTYFAGNRLGAYIKWVVNPLGNLIAEVEHLLSIGNQNEEKGIPVAVMLINLLDLTTWICLHAAEEEKHLLSHIFPLVTQLLKLSFENEKYNTQTNSLPLFDGAWELFEKISSSGGPHDIGDTEHVLKGLLLKFEETLIDRSPSQRELYLMHTVLKRIRPNDRLCGMIRKLLVLHCNWIPHSVEDLTFFVTADMLRSVRKHLDGQLMETVLQSLLDRGTTRASIRDETLEILVTIMLNSRNSSADLLNYCWVGGLRWAEKAMDSLSYGAEAPGQYLSNDIVEDRLFFFRRMLHRYDPWHYQTLLTSNQCEQFISTLLRIVTEYPRATVRELAMELISKLFRGWIKASKGNFEENISDKENLISEVGSCGANTTWNSELCWDLCEWLGRVLDEAVAPSDGWASTDAIQHSALDLCEYILTNALPMPTQEMDHRRNTAISLFHSRRLHVVFLLWDTLYFLLDSPVSAVPYRALRLILSVVQDTVHDTYRSVRRADYPSIFMNLRQLHMRSLECVEKMLIDSEEWVLRLGGITMLRSMMEANFPPEQVNVKVWESVFTLRHIDGLSSVRKSAASILLDWCPTQELQRLESKYSLSAKIDSKYSKQSKQFSEVCGQSCLPLFHTGYSIDDSSLEKHGSWKDMNELLQQEEVLGKTNPECSIRMADWIESLLQNEIQDDEMHLLSTEEDMVEHIEESPKSEDTDFPVVNRRSTSKERPKSARRSRAYTLASSTEGKKRPTHKRSSELSQEVLQLVAEQQQKQNPKDLDIEFEWAFPEEQNEAFLDDLCQDTDFSKGIDKNCDEQFDVNGKLSQDQLEIDSDSDSDEDSDDTHKSKHASNERLHNSDNEHSQPAAETEDDWSSVPEEVIQFDQNQGSVSKYLQENQPESYHVEKPTIGHPGGDKSPQNNNELAGDNVEEMEEMLRREDLCVESEEYITDFA